MLRCEEVDGCIGIGWQLTLLLTCYQQHICSNINFCSVCFSWFCLKQYYSNGSFLKRPQDPKTPRPQVPSPKSRSSRVLKTVDCSPRKPCIQNPEPHGIDPPKKLHFILKIFFYFVLTVSPCDATTPPQSSSLRKSIFMFKTPLIFDKYRYLSIIKGVLNINLNFCKHSFNFNNFNFNNSKLSLEGNLQLIGRYLPTSATVLRITYV